MKKILQNFITFTEKISSGQKFSASSDSIISFSSRIDSVDFDVMIDNLCQRNIKFFYWNKPWKNLTLLGFDPLISIGVSGDDRTLKTEEALRGIKNNFFNNWSDNGLENVPLFLGSMKFSPSENSTLWNEYEDSDWFLPKMLFLRKGHNLYIIYNFLNREVHKLEHTGYLTNIINILKTHKLPAEKSFPTKFYSSELDTGLDKDQWFVKVNEALSKIHRGDFEKIVLSRQVAIELSDSPPLYEILNRLSKEYVNTYIFAYKNNSSVFFGASPEKLAEINRGWIEADALAGSISRGVDEKEDEILANELLTSKKNLAEQRAVVKFIKESFSSFAEINNSVEMPIIKKLPNIQHLWTPIKAKLHRDRNIFSILQEIHPTPAICGVPWSAAISSIRDMENHRRGLFAGIIGWFNFENEGEFAVAIRSALLRNKKIYAFAGCGIVEGSDPVKEYEEAELKLKPILSLFENEKIYQP